MTTNWDWSPIAGAFQGLMQQRAQQQQYSDLLKTLSGPGGMPQTPAQLLMTPQTAQVAPSQSGDSGLSSTDQMTLGLSPGGGDPQAQTPSISAPAPSQGALGGIAPQFQQILARLPPQVGMPLLMQIIGDKISPKAHTFSSTRDGQVYDTSTGQMLGTSVKAQDEAKAAAQNQAEAQGIAGTNATGNIGSLDALPLDPGSREALRSLVQTGGAKGLQTYGDVVKAQADKSATVAADRAPTVRQFTEGDQTVERQWNPATKTWDKVSGGPRKIADAVVPLAPQDLTTDPDSGSILKQTGLSLPAFMALTGKASSLPRDAATRNRAFAEAQAFANKRGVDVSTLTSQYQAYNETLNKNIQRVNQTKIMEGELAGTIDNLQPVADAAGAGRLKIANVAKIWAGQETNDPTTEQYAFQLNQLRSELAAYNGALQGRTGASLTQQDYAEAERVIKNGLSSKGAEGLRSAVSAATQKMGAVLAKNVDTARKGVWDLFGVGGNFKPQAPSASSSTTSGRFKIEQVQ